MRTNPLRLAINDDVDAEFTYWKSQFLNAVWLASGLAIAAAAAIAIWPEGIAPPDFRDFVRHVWPLFVECAFWLGFLLGLLWGAAKRLSSGLSGVLPWHARQRLSRKAWLACLSGQWASCFALAGVFIWMSRGLAGIADAGLPFLHAALTLLVQACLGLAALFALAAFVGRDRTGGRTVDRVD